MTKRLPVTKYKRLGPIFGTPLLNLEEDDLPKACDIIRYWMSCYEIERGDSWLLQEKQKISVRNEVSPISSHKQVKNCLVKYYEQCNLMVLSEIATLSFD